MTGPTVHVLGSAKNRTNESSLRAGPFPQIRLYPNHQTHRPLRMSGSNSEG